MLSTAGSLIPDELNRDLSTLAERGFEYQVREEGPRVYVLFANYPLPSDVYYLGGMSVDTTRLLIFTTQFYPNAGFDMFWVEEGLTLKGGGIPKNADVIETYLGQQWRRFSYHPYNNRPWNPSEDNVVSFMANVDHRLGRGD
ncbi:MAG TPA: E2/UBC family protein [Candidatus Bathyarchaeia archaeon]|nr:E2/UBC family protein [Candidatus Bathyarchaeia archaeon]